MQTLHSSTMSEVQSIMKFELLPNEILIECFEYLDALNIVHSFDGLNHRFNQLIRNIRLYLDFEHVTQSTYDHFCMKILSNPEINNRILSLKVTATVAYRQTHPFFNLTVFRNFTSIINIIISRQCSTDELRQLFKYTPVLKHLNVNTLQKYSNNTTTHDICLANEYAAH